MKNRFLSTITILVSLTVILAAGGTVYADSHADAHANAGAKGASTSTYACHDAYAEAFAKTEGESSTRVHDGYESTGERASYAYAEANSKGGGYADADVYVDVGNTPYEGKIYGYAVSTASGSGSWANSDVDIYEVIPAGAYIDVDAEGSSYAIAFLLSDGSTVWGVAVTNASGGKDAVAVVSAGHEGTSVVAIVDNDIPK
jgi:hypothetical protein